MKKKQILEITATGINRINVKGRRIGMEREKIIKGIECCRDRIKDDLSQTDEPCYSCPYAVNGNVCSPWELYDDTLALLKEQDNEKKRIMKVIWDTLHEGLSIDTVADQDWVYEQIRHKIEDT